MSKTNKYDNDIIYSLLNYAEVEDYNIGNFKLDKTTSKRIRNNINKKLNIRKIKSKYIAAAILLISLVSFSIAKPTFASNIHNSIIQTIEVFRGDYADYEKYASNINLSSYDRGIKFVINQIVSDNNEIWISYSIISDKKFEEVLKNQNTTSIMSFMEFDINGKKIGSDGGQGRFINDKRYDGVLEINTMRENIKNIFYLSMDVKSIDKLEGNWKFNLKVNKKDIQKETKIYNINKSISLGKDKIFIKKISTSPISTSIQINGSIEKYQYFLLDDKGNEIKARGASSSSTDGEIHFNNLINSNTKYLTFIPFQHNDNYKMNPITYDISKLPLELSQGSLGKLVVTNMTWDKDTLKISYTVHGKIPVTQAGGLLLFDENGKFIEPENRFGTQKSISNQHDFEMYFKGLSENKKYKIGTAPLDDFYKINDKLKFTVELK
ncbi:DUF4179 domain-containing protein [Clostridium sp. JNZ X4-2]